MKVQIEWKDGDAWRQVKVEVSYSSNGNYWFQHNGIIYVFPTLKDGTPVVMKAGSKWIRVGRVIHNYIFLGDGLSWSETNELKFKAEMKWEKPIFEEVKA